jgi:hypothetical protein
LKKKKSGKITVQKLLGIRKNLNGNKKDKFRDRTNFNKGKMEFTEGRLVH